MRKINPKLMMMTIIVLSLLLPAPSVFAQVGQDHPMIQITLQSYDPFPTEPGSQVNLKFRATNIGGRTATDPSFELDPRAPFRAEEGHSLREDFGSMAPGESVTFEFTARVSDDAVVGSSSVRLQHTTDGDSWILTEHDIVVRVAESILGIKSVSTSPDMLPPGDVSEIDILLENSGSTTIRDVSLKLDFDAMVEAEVDNVIPFAPSGSTGEKRLPRIDGGEDLEFNYEVLTFADADSGIYRVPIVLSYRDESGEVITKTDNIGVRVGADPKLSATLDSIDYSPGNTEVSFRIVNRGVIDLKFVNVRLDESDDFDLISSSDEFYIGRLSSDDFDSISFDIEIDENSDVVELPLIVEYLDANNQEHTNEFDMTLDMETIRRRSSPEAGLGSTLVLLVIIGALGYFGYRRLKKRKQKQRR